MKIWAQAYLHIVAISPCILIGSYESDRLGISYTGIEKEGKRHMYNQYRSCIDVTLDKKLLCHFSYFILFYLILNYYFCIICTFRGLVSIAKKSILKFRNFPLYVSVFMCEMYINTENINMHDNKT